MLIDYKLSALFYQFFRCICIVERAGLSVYSYMGRLLASPRLGARPETLGKAAVSLGPDALAAIDQTDRKSMY
jgi:hypothetical protein